MANRSSGKKSNDGDADARTCPRRRGFHALDVPAENRSFSLIGKTALITGAGGGIGRATALRFAAAGAELLLHANRSRTAVESVAEELRGHGRTVGTWFGDLSRREQCETLIADIARSGRGTDIFVHAVGLDVMDEPVRSLPFAERLERLWRTDVVSAVTLARAFGEQMRSRGGGRIVLFGWNETGEGLGIPGDTAQLYAAAKGAVVAFMRSLAESLAPQVRVNAISPGWIRTRWGAGASAPMDERARAASLSGRWGIPEEVAEAALFLVSDEAAFINKQNLKLDGGRRSRFDAVDEACKPHGDTIPGS